MAKSTLGTYLGYGAFRLLLFGFGLLPFWFCYRISDFLYLILYYVLKYRRKVVRQNLSNSFPDKSLKELKQIERKFYQHLSDIFIEGIRGLSMRDATAIKRWKILTPEAPNSTYAQGKASMFVGAHYNNWEWGAMATRLQVEPHVIVFYKPINNPLIDQYLRRRRMQKGVELIPIQNTAKAFEMQTASKPMYNLIADQSPSNVVRAHWIEFLHQETAVLHGPAYYAQKYNIPIWFIYINKIKRGFYEVSAELLIEDPQNYSAHEISERFMRKVEAQIIKQPENWLWSHRRWKRKKPKSIN